MLMLHDQSTGTHPFCRLLNSLSTDPPRPVRHVPGETVDFAGYSKCFPLPPTPSMCCPSWATANWHLSTELPLPNLERIPRETVNLMSWAYFWYWSLLRLIIFQQWGWNRGGNTVEWQTSLAAVAGTPSQTENAPTLCIPHLPGLAGT